MIIKAGLNRGVRFFMSGLKVILSVTLAACFSLATAQAHEDLDGYVPISDYNALFNAPGKNLLKFEFNQRPEDGYPYQIARKSMSGLFKGTSYDTSRPGFSNPMIMINQTDLNGDNLPETISFPMESESDTLCKWVTVCPHYIIEQRGEKSHILGVINAENLSLGDSVKNGYWTIRAFTKKDETSQPRGFYYETYQYDKKKDGYVKVGDGQVPQELKQP